MYTSHSTCTMLARFITNRQVAICRLVMNLASNCALSCKLDRDSHGYLCMGPKLTGEFTSPSSLINSRMVDSTVLPARQLLPAFVLFLPLPLFLPILQVISPSTRGLLTDTSSTVTATLLPDGKPSKLQYAQAAWCLGTSLRVYSMESTTTEGAPVAEGLPEGSQRHWRLKKNDRDRNTLITGNRSRVHSSRVVDSRQNLDGNQSNLSCICPLTRIPRITCACTSEISGYIKRVE